MHFSKEEKALSKIDPTMAALIKKNGSIIHIPKDTYFGSLCGSIISQQISVKAAAKIFERFEKKTQLLPQNVVSLHPDDVSEIGLSGQKTRYLMDLAKHFIKDSALFDHLSSLSDDDVITELTRVKGIGVWTAQMFLMFTLVRIDVFAPDDRGLQLAIQKLYNLENVPARSELDSIAMKWSPYRTVASWHLWRSLDNEPTP